MASGFCLSNAQAYAQALAINVNTTGLGGAVLTIYSDAHDKPIDADTAMGVQQELVSFTLPLANLNTISPYGIITLGTVSDALAVGTGKASWFRIVASNGATIVCDGTVGLSSESCDLTLSTTDITTGARVVFPVHTYIITKK